MTSQTFHMPSRLDAVDPMVLTLKGMVEGFLSGEALCRFDICLSESLANLVLHAETAVTEPRIKVILATEEGLVNAQIFDPEGAQPFDIRDSARDLADVDALEENGRGLGLILECADAVEYGPVNDSNRLSLTFRERP